MRDIWNEITEWSEGEKPFSIARVIRTWRSAPRSSGAGMIVGEGMEVAGSVSGGCIEGAVIEEAGSGPVPLRELRPAVQEDSTIQSEESGENS